MSENSKKWKSRFLSSSLPLEFEIAKILTNKGFSVSYDYSFLRKEGNDYKEFSTDIKGLLFFPQRRNRIDATLDLLVECKYRDIGKKWLFLPDTNKLEFTDQTLGYSLRTMDAFSMRKLNKNSIYYFESKFKFALKGVEINTETGEVFDKDIKHGLYQLKYALPHLIKDSIEFNLYGHIEDVNPRFILPILVTNAELFILKKEFTIETLNQSNNIEEFSEKVPYIICYSEIGPDFTEHHKRIFDMFYENNKSSKILRVLDEEQKKHITQYNYYQSPIEICNDLENSFKFVLSKYYTHFIICSSDNFDFLVQEIMKTISKTIKK